MSPSDSKHNCPWPGCERRVPRHIWGCRQHWYMLPEDIRRKIGASWRGGTVGEHMAALEEADSWIETHYGASPHARRFA